MTVRMRGMDDWLRIACAVLLLSLGFGHKPVQATPRVADSLAYALSGGDYAGQLCIASDDEGAPPMPGWHGCDVCLVASGGMLPAPPADFLAAPTAFSAIEFPTQSRTATLKAWRPGSPVRGPPVLFA